MASMRRRAKATAASARRASATARSDATPAAPAAPRSAGRQGPPIATRRALGRYLGMFLLFAVALFAVYQFSESTHRFRYVNAANAAICGRILGWVGVANQTTGTTVTIRTTNMEIISECSAIYVAILFMAGVLAFPTTWRARLRGLAFGLPCIFAINVLRLVSLGLVIQHRAALLPLFHEYLWQVLFVLVVAVLYLLWIERFVPREEARQTA
jgi:exosortase H (IPTLxxWG-CTERM-specific)